MFNRIVPPELRRFFKISVSTLITFTGLYLLISDHPFGDEKPPLFWGFGLIIFGSIFFILVAFRIMKD